MLAWFRKMQTVIAPLMLAVFFGGLFSLYCEHCLLKQVQARQAVTAVTHSAGHCPQHAAGGHPQPTPAKPCLGVCDCGANSMLMLDNHALVSSDHRGGWETGIPIPAPAYLAAYTPGKPAYVIGAPDQPDRACITPLERNCVLLN